MKECKDVLPLKYNSEMVFLASSINDFFGYNAWYTARTIKKLGLKEGTDFIKFEDKEEKTKFINENIQKINELGLHLNINNNMKYVVTLAGFKKIYDFSNYRQKEFPFLLGEIDEVQPRKTVTDLKVKEFNNQRVITFKDIDEVHGRPEGTARKTYNQNKKRFIEGEDFFVLNSDEAAKYFETVAPNGLKLLSESGYLMLVKSFTDDLAWEVQRKLVNNYFRAKKYNEVSLPQTYEEALVHLLESVRKEKMAQQQIEVLSPKAERYEDLMNAENCQDMNEVAKAFKTGRNRLFSYLREQKVIMADKALPYQKYIEKGYFLVIEVEKNNLIHTKTLVTPLGIDFIAKLLNENPPKQGFFDKVKSLFTKNSPMLPTSDTHEI